MIGISALVIFSILELSIATKSTHEHFQKKSSSHGVAHRRHGVFDPGKVSTFIRT